MLIITKKSDLVAVFLISARAKSHYHRKKHEKQRKNHNAPAHPQNTGPKNVNTKFL